jgi:hypothetical protein
MLLAALTPQQPGATRVAPPVMQMTRARRMVQDRQLQGGSLRTWSYGSGQPDQVHFDVGSDGRPVDAQFELWQGPGNTPVRSRVYGDDGYARHVSATVGTGNSGWGTNTVTMRNRGPLEFPVNAEVGASNTPHPSAYQPRAAQQRIQGGALKTFTLDGTVGSVTVHLQSEGLPISAVIEILQGPNSERQSIDLYSDDGRRKPVSYLLELPGYGSTISITNTGPMTFPLTAAVVPYGPQRMEQQSQMGYGAMPFGMDDYGMPGAGRYGAGDPYGRNGQPRRVGAAQMQTGQKWFERGQPQGGVPRGRPPSYEEHAAMQARGPPGYMEDGMHDSFQRWGAARSAPAPSYAEYAGARGGW